MFFEYVNVLTASSTLCALAASGSASANPATSESKTSLTDVRIFVTSPLICRNDRSAGRGAARSLRRPVPCRHIRRMNAPPRSLRCLPARSLLQDEGWVNDPSARLVPAALERVNRGRFRRSGRGDWRSESGLPGYDSDSLGGSDDAR